MPITRIPLTQPIETRDGLLNTWAYGAASYGLKVKDSRSVNGYFESSQGKREFVKRPGYLLYTNTSGLPSGKTPRGFYQWAFNKNFYIAYDSNTAGTTDIYTVTTGGSVTLVGNVAGTAHDVNFISTDSANTYLFFKTTSNAFLIWKAAPTTITTITLPTGGVGQRLVPGVCFLDGYIAIGDETGRIYTSNVNDPTTWNALNYVTAEANPDPLIGIGKHLNYIVAFGSTSIQFLYDAGTSPGSPLAFSLSYTLETGCINGNTIVPIEQSIIWVGASIEQGRGAFMMDGVNPVKISTPYIDRILDNDQLNRVYAYSFKYRGHTFYVLTMIVTNVTIVYDVNEKVWTQWTSYSLGATVDGVSTGDPAVYAEQIFRLGFFNNSGTTNTASNSAYYFLDLIDNKIYVIYSDSLDSNFSASDNGAPIYYRSVTDIVDSGTTKRKFYQRVEIVGDKAPATLFIRHTDDDYNTWSAYRSVDLNAPRAQIYQTGAARRRAWEFLCTDNQPLRLDAAEIDFSVGELEQEGVAPTNYRT